MPRPRRLDLPRGIGPRSGCGDDRLPVHDHGGRGRAARRHLGRRDHRGRRSGVLTSGRDSSRSGRHRPAPTIPSAPTANPSPTAWLFDIRSWSSTVARTTVLAGYIEVMTATSESSPSLVAARYETFAATARQPASTIDRKSTRLNSSHLGISYAVFCLKKKK